MISYYVLRLLQRVSLAFWLGEMLFFVVVFAPRVFQVLARPDAAALQASIFPAYYTVGLISGVVLFLSTLALHQFFYYGKLSQKALLWGLGLTLVCTAVFAVGKFYMTPELTALQPKILQEPVEAGTQETFDGLHSLSVKLNGFVLLALMALLIIL